MIAATTTPPITQSTIKPGLARKDHEIYIMVLIIELSGVKFGMKSYPLFQNRTSAEREFDLKSQVRF